MNTTRSIAILTVLCMTSALADQTIPDNYDTTSSSKTLTVAPGDVDTYTGLFSGSKNLYLSAGSEGTVVGGGTAVLTNPENTFSGTFGLGLTAANPNGVFRFDSAGASGTARCYTSGGSKEGSIRQFQFNAEGATFHNNLEMGGSGNTGYEYSPFKFMKSCTLAGTIVTALSGGKRSGKTIAIIDDPNERPTVNFLGDVEVGGHFSLVPSGTFKMYGALSVPGILFLDSTNVLGTVELYNHSNAISQVMIGYTNLRLMEPNVLTNATLNLSTTRLYETAGAADVYLYANQSIKAFACGSRAYRNAGVIYAAVASELAFEGHAEDSASNKCRFAFNGPLSLVKTGTGIQDFNYRNESTMTGAITVRGGTFKVSGTAAFPNASAVNVENGLLDLNVATPFSKLQSVSIGSTGQIASSSSTSITIETDNLEIGGQTLLKGFYTSATHPANIGEGITIKCNKKGGLMMILR